MFQLIKDTFRDKEFIKKTAVIALPVALQSLLNTVVNMIDTMMIGTLGEVTIAAVGLANKVFFVFGLLVFGIASGASVLGAQFWGNHDVKNIRRVLGLSLLIGLAGSLIFVLPGLFCPEFVMRIFTGSEETIRIGAMYLAVVCISYPLTAVTNIYTAILRSMGIVNAPVLISVITILINVFFNYLLIFGKFGFAAMGVVGAAIATLIARVVECVLILAVVYLRKTALATRLPELLGYSRDFLKEYCRTSLPVVGNEFVWGLGVTMYSLVYGRMINSDSVVATMTIFETFQNLMQVMVMGLSSAATVVIGNTLGSGNKERGWDEGKKLICLQVLVSLLFTVFILLTGSQYVKFYSVSETVSHAVTMVMVVYAIYLTSKNVNLMMIVGLFRGGGDTRIGLIMDLCGVWVIGVPMAVLGGLVLKLPIWWVYAMVNLEEVMKNIVCIRRFRSKKWLNNLNERISG
ncbi:MAG: MATE family efflux transporter [Lachnospiraceae bacterium]|nr:MATE family efflux transporter [Lachnospiraceae bacterium]